MTTPARVSAQDVHDALQSLKDCLEKEFQKLPPGPDRRVLDDLLDSIDSSLTTLNQEGISAHTVTLDAAAESMESPLRQLDALQAELKSIAGNFGKAAKVLEGAGKVLSAVTSYFGIK